MLSLNQQKMGGVWTMSKKNQEEIKENIESESKEELTKESDETIKLQSDIQELTKMLQITQADFQNYKKRIQNEKEELQTHLKKDLVTRLLPVLDMFELCLEYKENTQEFVKGVEMTHKQFLATLEQEGLETISTDEFDPKLHEAVITEDGRDGQILEVLQKGYKIKNQVLRCTRVKVGKEEKNE